MSLLRSAALVACIATTGLAAQAATFSPVAASTTAPIAYPGPENAPGWLIDGVIDYDQYLVVGHEGYGNFAGPYTVSFDLGGAHDLTGMTLWNNAGYLGNDGEGVGRFTLRFLDAQHGLLGSYVGDANDGLAAQDFSFAAAQVHHVDLVIESNRAAPGGRAYAALYEVQFSGTPAVPEPASWAMLGLGVGLLGWRARRRG